MAKRKGQRHITGKKAELKVIGRLLQEHFPVYAPVVDIEGVDCIIRNDKGSLLEIQVKSSGKDAKEPYKIVFKWDKNSRKNFIFIFYVEKEDSYWIIPSEYLTGKDGKQIHGPNKGGYCGMNLMLTNHNKWYKEFKDNWELLHEYI